MISKNIQSALNNQINAELWSAYLYLAMSMDAEAKALKGIANWFFVQWLEEQDHARILQKYMVSQNARVILKQIDGVTVDWKSVKSLFEDTLDHERNVSAMIHNIMRQAKEENDYATENLMLWFVEEQVEEEESASDILSDIEILGDSRYGKFSLDKYLAERKYKMAEPLE